MGFKIDNKQQQFEASLSTKDFPTIDELLSSLPTLEELLKDTPTLDEVLNELESKSNL